MAGKATALRAGGWEVPPAVARRAVEPSGVGLVGRGRLREYLEEARPLGARMIGAVFATKPRLAVICGVAPHAGRAGAEKEAFYLQLAERAQSHSSTGGGGGGGLQN